VLRIEHHPILSFSRSEPVVFAFEDRAVTGYRGEPIAAALHAAGIRVLRESPKLKRPRGFFCALGRCSSCLVVVDGVPNVMACITPVREGMVVHRQVGKGRIA
jgi:predicted molibdopterin-dependent oxidoreductase YjgC